MDNPNKLDEALRLLREEVEQLRKDNEDLMVLVKGLTKRLKEEKNADGDVEWAKGLAEQIAETVVKRISDLKK